MELINSFKFLLVFSYFSCFIIFFFSSTGVSSESFGSFEWDPKSRTRREGRPGPACLTTPRLPKKCNCENHTTYDNKVSIYCSQTNFTSVPAFMNVAKNIRKLTIVRSNLSSLKEAPFYGLEISQLILSDNRINDISYLAFWGQEITLTSLDLSFNRLNTVPEPALRPLRELKFLILSCNNISKIRNKDFVSLLKLEVLILNSNPIRIIERNGFEGLRNLVILNLNCLSLENGLKSIPNKHIINVTELSLMENGLKEVPKHYFGNFVSLTRLNLAYNNISSLPFVCFSVKPTRQAKRRKKKSHTSYNLQGGAYYTIKSLDLSYNSMHKMPKRVLQQFKNLKTLNLGYNSLEKLHGRVFNVSSKTLKELIVRNNNISMVSPRAFEGIENSIRLIDLRYNAIYQLNKRSFKNLNESNRPEVYLEGNRIFCNCKMTWLRRAYKNKLSDPWSRIFVDLNNLICFLPSKYTGRKFTSLRVQSFDCDYYDHYYDEYEIKKFEYFLENSNNEDFYG